MISRMQATARCSLRRLPRILPTFYVSAVRFESEGGSLQMQRDAKQDSAISCSVFDGSHIGLIKSILHNDFAEKREPMRYHLSARNFDFLVDPCLINAMSDGNTVIVKVDEDVAGVALNDDFTVKENEALVRELKKRDYFGFDIVFEIAKELSIDFRHEMQDKDLWHKGNILRMSMVAVDPRFAHQGLGTLLTRKVIEKAKDKGFKYVTCEATNSFMKHICGKCGFESVNTIKYEDWEYPKWSGIKPKAGMPAITGFDEMNLMVFRIPQHKK